MTRIIYLLIIIIAITSCSSPKALSEPEVYNILNEIITDDSLAFGDIYYEFSNLNLDERTRPEFSEKDVDFIYKQKETLSNITIKSNTIKKYYWKTIKAGSPYADIKNKIDKDYSLNQFSFPLISIDRTIVLIEIQTIGHCSLCGNGGKYLYKKINNRWKRIKTYDEWQS